MSNSPYMCEWNQTKAWGRCITNLTLFLGRGCQAVNTLNSEFEGRGSRKFTQLCLSSPRCVNGYRRNTTRGNFDG